MTGAAETSKPSNTANKGTFVPKTFPGKPAPPPLTPLPFKVGDVRAAIPAHCFQRDTLRSLSHVAIDLSIAAVLFYASTWISTLPLALRFLAWPIYWYAQGTILTGVWVLAHECGHGAFSPSRFVCDTVGWVLHSALLVPYFSWKYSHAAHHRNTCSVEHDEVFVPAARSDLAAEMIAETPAVNFVQIVLMLTVGWPGYLLFNSSGPAKYRNAAHNSHFHPMSALFTDRQRLFVALSDVGILGAVALLAYASYTFGVANVLFYYFVPYLVVNAYLVLITFLQHTDVYIPHYREKEFDWLRGALATVDRSYGWLLNTCLHHISDTHVAHHIFHEMPFYHAQEATAALQKFLGPYYLKDDTPFPTALWQSWKNCKFLEDDGDILFYKDATAYGEKRDNKKSK